MGQIGVGEEGEKCFRLCYTQHILFTVIWHQMVKEHSVNEKGNPLPSLHGLLFFISSKEFFICTIPQTG